MILLHIGLALLCPQFEAMIDQLKDPRLDREAVRFLVSADPHTFVADLEEALRQDPAFTSGNGARILAFRVLSQARSIEVVGNSEIRRITDPLQLALLEEGLSDADFSVRSECVQSLPYWRSDKRAEAILWLQRTLSDGIPDVRILACKAASVFGVEARSCLPELDLLLRNQQTPERAFDWSQPIGPTGDTADRAPNGRMEAALARMLVSSFTVDRNLYDAIDAVGKDALVRAWARFIYFAIAEQLEFDRTWERKSPMFAQVEANEEVLSLLLRPEHYVRLEDGATSSLQGCIALLVQNGRIVASVLPGLRVAADQLTSASGLSEEERVGAVRLKERLDRL